jgi:hypothetical protein
MYHSQVNEYKYEIERLTRELQDLKRKYYDIKKRERENRGTKSLPEALARLINEKTGGLVGHTDAANLVTGREIANTPITLPLNNALTNNQLNLKPHPPNGPKFSGGGFNLSTGPLQTVHHQIPKSTFTINPVRTSTAPAAITPSGQANEFPEPPLPSVVDESKIFIKTAALDENLAAESTNQQQATTVEAPPQEKVE